jgi:hypothetical protein
VVRQATYAALAAEPAAEQVLEMNDLLFCNKPTGSICQWMILNNGS